jgi:hypothetical protein
LPLEISHLRSFFLKAETIGISVATIIANKATGDKLHALLAVLQHAPAKQHKKLKVT